MTKDRLIMWLWIILPAYIMIHVMLRVTPKIGKWDAGVLCFVCLVAWMQFIEWEVAKYNEKQKKHRRAILRERLNKHDR